MIKKKFFKEFGFFFISNLFETIKIEASIDIIEQK
jgi:hypothetical protein